MAANNKKSYLGHLNKLVVEYNNTYNSFGKKNCWCWLFCLTEEVEKNPKAPKIKVGDRVRITIIKTFLVKVTLKIDQKKHLWLILN